MVNSKELRPFNISYYISYVSVNPSAGFYIPSMKTFLSVNLVLVIKAFSILLLVMCFIFPFEHIIFDNKYFCYFLTSLFRIQKLHQ